MRIVIAGGHGKIARRLERLLTARGDRAVGLVRGPGQGDDLREVGAEPVVCDLESSSVEEVAGHLRGADAVVFAAGAGPGSGVARKDTVDHAAAVLFADAARAAGVRRFVIVSSMGAGAEPPPGTGEVFAAYLRAKRAADLAVQAGSDLDWTVLRPGGLTDEPGGGAVSLAEHTGRGSVSRDDVAAVLLALLDTPGTARRTLELTARGCLADLCGVACPGTRARGVVVGRRRSASPPSSALRSPAPDPAPSPTKIHKTPPGPVPIEDAVNNVTSD